jgi:hypothetical protein
VGNPQPATQVVYDFLDALVAELAARGLDYRAVVVRQGSDVELPSITGDDLRLTDRQAILVRAGVQVTGTDDGTYSVNLTVPVGGAGGPPVTLSRGWVSADATIAGRQVRFVCTHLERGSVEPVQVAQAMELQQIVAAASLPVVVVGDFNSAADGSRTATYGMLTSAGFVDAFAEARPSVDGYTCCHDDDMRNDVVDFNRRIDLVFTRAVDAQRYAGVRDAVVVGADPALRSADGLWASDHAGVTLSLGVYAERAWMQARAAGSRRGTTSL